MGGAQRRGNRTAKLSLPSVGAGGKLQPRTSLPRSPRLRGPAVAAGAVGSGKRSPLGALPQASSSSTVHQAAPDWGWGETPPPTSVPGFLPTSKTSLSNLPTRGKNGQPSPAAPPAGRDGTAETAAASPRVSPRGDQPPVPGASGQVVGAGAAAPSPSPSSFPSPSPSPARGGGGRSGRINAGRFEVPVSHVIPCRGA